MAALYLSSHHSLGLYVDVERRQGDSVKMMWIIRIWKMGMSGVNCPELAKLGVRLALALGQLPNTANAHGQSYFGDTEVSLARKLLYEHQQNCSKCNRRPLEAECDDVAAAS